MRDVRVIAAATIRECARRRVFGVVIVLTIAFLALYALGNSLVFDHALRGRTDTGSGSVDLRTLAGATLIGLAMFATLFLGAIVAVFLTMNVVRGDAELGLLQPVIVRPAGREAFIAGRFAAAAIVCSGYNLAVYLASVTITGLIGDWWPDSVLLPGLALAAAAVVVASLSLLGSVYLPTVANGIAILMLFGGGLIAGLMGQIGDALNSGTLQSVATITAWALPFEALYEAGLHALTSGTYGITGVIVRLGPLGGAQAAGPGLVLWTVAYLALAVAAAIASLRRRDL
jgi:Cu-processing system permease protein